METSAELLMDLFQECDFISHAGLHLKWKIEMDALSDAEWEACATIIMEYQKRPFYEAVGIPRGGVPLGNALDKYSTGNIDHPLLIADDVYTTGTSFKEFKEEYYPNEATLQWCIFAREPTIGRVKALFTMPDRGRKGTNW